MRISDLGLDFIKTCEGCKLEAYTDTAGVRTIGYGHAYWEGADVISEEKASELLESDIKKFESAVNKYDDIYKWSQNEFDALVSFAFNLGGIDKLTANGTRSKNEISEKMLLYYNSGGKKVFGLVKRRSAEQLIFREGRYLTDPYGTDQKKYSMLVCDSGQVKEDIRNAVKGVLKGEYGDGNDRKRALMEDGYDSKDVQDAVNMLYGLKSKEVDLKKLKEFRFTLNNILNMLMLVK